MAWTKLTFGKYKGKTLPQVLFMDPDWFFWAFENGAFNNKGKLLSEAKEIFSKATAIRISQTGGEKLVAEYAIHPVTKNFVDFEILPASRPAHIGATQTFRSDKIDLSAPRQIAHYDKLGNNLFISKLKLYLFGKKDYRMTKARCEAFFEDDKNFDV